MSENMLTLALADYARIMPLATDAVAPEGVKLNVITSQRPPGSIVRNCCAEL